MGRAIIGRLMMQEENRNSTSGVKGSWLSFILATICTLPFVVFSLLHLMATTFNMPMLLAFLRFAAVGFSPFFAIAALIGLISIGFAMKQQPKFWLLLIVYALIILGDIASWIYAISNLGSM
jgi:nicotinamide riboside transporter PnuC